MVDASAHHVVEVNLQHRRKRRHCWAAWIQSDTQEQKLNMKPVACLPWLTG